MYKIYVCVLMLTVGIGDDLYRGLKVSVMTRRTTSTRSAAITMRIINSHENGELRIFTYDP